MIRATGHPGPLTITILPPNLELQGESSDLASPLYAEDHPLAERTTTSNCKSDAGAAPTQPGIV